VSQYTDPLLPAPTADDAPPKTKGYLASLATRLYELFVNTSQRLTTIETTLGTVAGDSSRGFKVDQTLLDVTLGPSGYTGTQNSGLPFIPAAAVDASGSPAAQTGFVPIAINTGTSSLVAQGALLYRSAGTWYQIGGAAASGGGGTAAAINNYFC